MAGPGFDVRDLNRLAATLAQGAQDLEGLAGNAPAMPDAGTSSGAVGDGISALADVMSKVVQTAANGADLAQASGNDYQGADSSAEESMNKLRGPR